MFRLAKLLAYKERLEREALVELAEAERLLASLESQADSLGRDRLEVPDGADEPARLAEWAIWGESLRRREERLRGRAGRLRPEVDDKRRVHRELRREVEGLRKLRERERQRRKRRLEHVQQEQTDDVAARRRLPGAGNFFREGTGLHEPAERAGEPIGTTETGESPDRARER